MGTPAFYQLLDEGDVSYGSAFRGVEAVWTGPGEALGEVAVPGSETLGNIEVHPAQLDGCFQVVAAVAEVAGGGPGTAFVPLGWDRLWVRGPLPERVMCHARLREGPVRQGVAPEALTADLRLYDLFGEEIGGANGFVLRRATRSALLAAAESVGELLYDVVWRERPYAGGPRSADFLAAPLEAGRRLVGFERQLAAEGADAGSLAELQADLERLAQGYALAALEQLGWRRKRGAVDPGRLRRRLKVVKDQEQLFGRLFELLGESGVLEATAGGDWRVAAGVGDPLPAGVPDDPERLLAELEGRHPQGAAELGLLARCGAALADVLRGRADPVALLFGGEGPGAADLYRRSPAMRVANRMLGDLAAALAADLPEGERLSVLEVGAGTGSATAALLEAFPAGRLDYTFTDVSAGFFAAAEKRFGESGHAIRYRVLDIEADPAGQGFESQRYDLVVAANVLHATRDLGESLGNCRELLAPAGVLLALEGLQRQGWQDLTFGLLEGWWRFADRYRENHALVGEAVWREALADAGFGELALVAASGEAGPSDQCLIAARGPVEVPEAPGAWVLAPDEDGWEVASSLAEGLAGRNQTVVLAAAESAVGAVPECPGVLSAGVEPERRETWQSLLETLPADLPLRGVVHLAGLGGQVPEATAPDLAADARRAGASALALAQGLLDAAAEPAGGVWFVTRGAQLVDSEPGGQLVGAVLWGFGRVMALEAPQLRPRMVDLDAREGGVPGALVDELLHPDREMQIAHRADRRFGTRLVRATGAPLPGFSLRDDGTYLVTGGLGGIGPLVAGWLGDRGARWIVLNGRRQPDAGAEAAIAALRDRGLAVRVELADVADAGAVEGMLARIGADLPPLAGVLHCAGRRGGCGLGKPDLGALRTGVRAEGPGRVAPAPCDRGDGSGPVRAVLERDGSAGKRRAGEPRGGERLPGSTGEPPPGPGVGGTVNRVGGLVGPGRGRGAAPRDCRAAGGGRHGLDQCQAGPESPRPARDAGDGCRRRRECGLAGLRIPESGVAAAGGDAAGGRSAGFPGPLDGRGSRGAPA